MKFGQYELLELIAVGGMAEVFKGRVVAAEGFEKLVAIKRILPDLAEDERFVKMLLTEARIHSALSHRNIVQIHDLGISEDGQYFIVLEYVDGYDLRMITDQLGAEGEIIPEVLSLHIASELAQGLHFAHELRGADGQPLGLIHRDVSPSNVLISLAGEVKLSDFGLAKRRHDRSVVGSLKGNLSYMSPEQAMQVPLDRRSDIFSLGAVLFELLTGRRLREITDEVADWSRVASGAVPSVRTLRPDLPPDVERLLDRALAADPEQRFPDAAAFGNAIRQALAQMNVPVGASDLGALLGVVSPPRRPRSLMVERSRVIRLGPEARALREAIAAPRTPAPTRRLPSDDRPTPRTVVTEALSLSQSRTAAIAYRPASAAAPVARPAPSAPDPESTPPPPSPLPPVRVRAPTPGPPAPPQALAGQPSGGRPRRPTNPPLTARDAPAPRGTTGRYGIPQSIPPAIGSGRTSAPARPLATSHAGNPPLPRTPAFGVARPQLAGTPAFGVARPQLARTPAFGVARPPQAGTPAFGVARPPQAATPAFGVARPPQAGTPAFGVARPPQAGRPAFGAARPQFAPAPRTQSARFGMEAGALPAFAPTGQPQRQTARIQQLKPQGRWWRRLLFLLAIVAGGAAAVHRWVVPLDVLLVWRNPATLSIATSPSGATLRLDGVPLSDPSPAAVTIRRDLLEHVVEATLPGHRAARAIVRYDKTVALSFLMPLEALPESVRPPVRPPQESPGDLPSELERRPPTAR